MAFKDIVEQIDTAAATVSQAFNDLIATDRSHSVRHPDPEAKAAFHRIKGDLLRLRQITLQKAEENAELVWMDDL